ncbi:MAG: EamA family transporter [Synechococcales cyanobacterium C42_A2020_086]|jgi:DME family drug/metabolite transporter|nr:EamA family transporter [Synechococcales cyanobacterium C42_A2020_086]
MQVLKIAQTSASFGLLALLLAAMLWGTVGIVAQMIYQMTDTTPLSIGFWRLTLSVPLLLSVGWRTLGWQIVQIARGDVWLMLLIGAMTALYQVCYFGAIPQIGVAAATLVTLCAAPLWVALLAAVWLRERLTWSVAIAGVCAMFGTMLLVGPQPASPTTASTGLGVGLALGSALGYAVVTLCSRALAQRYHPLQSLVLGFGTGALLLLPFALATGLVIRYPVAGWLCLLYLGAIPTAAAYVLYWLGIRRTLATVASLVTMIEPLTATLLAWIVFQEQLGGLGIVGSVLLVGAIALLYWQLRS